MKKMLFLSLLILFITGALAVLSVPLHAAKAERDYFFEKARFIMTREEVDIYKHLEDPADKKTFIEEFWKKRDPDPTTEENENFEEFEKRIAYANRWFQENSKGNGWNSLRGRILLQLGFPDRREFGDASQTGYAGQLLTTKRIPMEYWYYYRMQLALTFVDANDSGHFTLSRIPSNLTTMLDIHKFSLDLREGYNVTKRSFKFDAKYIKDKLEISIPVKKLSFDEKDGKMKVDFHTTIYVYKNSKKTQEINVDKNFTWEKEELINLKFIKFDIPYPITEKGKYYLDIVVEEIGSASKFRDFVKHKV